MAWRFGSNKTTGEAAAETLPSQKPAQQQRPATATGAEAGEPAGSRFQVHEYARDHDQKTRGARKVPDPARAAALTAAPTDSTCFSVGVAAADQARPDVAISVFRPLADAGLTEAQANLGVLLATRLEPPELDEARRGYIRAAQAGNAAVVQAAEEALQTACRRCRTNGP